MESINRDNWHSVTISIPFPTNANASLVKQVIEVDRPLRPLELLRTLTVQDTILLIEFKAITISQARVALDHCISDVQLIVQTMHKFAPKREEEIGLTSAASLEIGLRGSWGGVAR